MSAARDVPPDPDRSQSPWANVEAAEFQSWGWQVKNRLSSLDDLRALFSLDDAETEGFTKTSSLFRFGATPYYALLADRDDPDCPIRRQLIPRHEEIQFSLTDLADPLGEEPREVVPNLIHRYPDRVLLLATDRCPVYCRFCTRRRIVGHTERQMTRRLLDAAFAYIEAHTELKEVIISGGDALMLADSQLDYILTRLRAAKHIDIVRVATRMPVTCPMRITEALVKVLKQHNPIYIMTHFNHPKECTPAAQEACARLVDAGLVVYNQSVLLKGINDEVDTIAALNRRLVYMRVTPYYLHQCDLAQGIEHFRTPLRTGLKIIDGLRGHMSGLTIPQLCVDVPGGHGKVTLLPEWVIKREGRVTTFRTYNGDNADYIDPVEG